MANPEASNDDRLWLLIKEGNRRAFDTIYHQYVGILYSAACSYTNNPQDAEDIIQEVFIDLWEKKAAITIESSLFNYLYSMARNRTLRYIRVNALKPATVELPEILLKEEQVTEKDIRNVELAVKEEIDKLPGQMKKIYRLNTESDMDIREIAALLHISPNTVKNHLVKVRKRLRYTVSRLASSLGSFI